MDSEKQYLDDEPTQEGQIDLASIPIEFCTDEFISDFYLKQYEDKEKWLREQRVRNESHREELAKAVQAGILKDSNPETILQRSIYMAYKRKKVLIEFRKEIEIKKDSIMAEVAKRLGKYLPDWSPKNSKIFFTIEQSYTCWCKNNDAYINLLVFVDVDDPIEKLIQYLTHELAHLWMQEPYFVHGVIYPRGKDRLIYSLVNEGFALLNGSKSYIKELHEQQGRNYEEFTKESFEFINDRLTENNPQELEKMTKECTPCLDKIYLVGAKIVETVLEHDGMEKFRALIVRARKDPSLINKRYQEICEINQDLPKINS